MGRQDAESETLIPTNRCVIDDAPGYIVHGTQDPCTSDHTAFALGRNNGGENVVSSIWGVRRLMPVECERLQGFPDNWTLVPTGKHGKPAADGPRYKQLGNSMPVPVMRWIGERIANYLKPSDDFEALL